MSSFSLRHAGFRLHRESNTIIFAINKNGDNYIGWLISTDEATNKHETGAFVENWVSSFQAYESTDISPEQMAITQELVAKKFYGDDYNQIALKVGFVLESPFKEENGIVNVKNKACFNISDVNAITYIDGMVRVYRALGDFEFNLSYGFEDLEAIYTAHKTGKKQKAIVK